MNDVARLDVRVRPGAKRNAWTGRMADGRHKVALAAPPVDGRANAALVAFVAECLGVPRRAVTLVAGAGTRDKRLEVDLAPEELAKRTGALDASADQGEG